METFHHGIFKIVYQSFTLFFISNRGAAEWQIAVARMLALSEFYSNQRFKKKSNIKYLDIKYCIIRDEMSHDEMSP